MVYSYYHFFNADCDLCFEVVSTPSLFEIILACIIRFNFQRLVLLKHYNCDKHYRLIDFHCIGEMIAAMEFIYISTKEDCIENVDYY